MTREISVGESKSIAGSLLIAHPSLRDSNFRRAVILMSNHDDEGALGVILNRPDGRVLGDLGSEFALGALAEVPLFKGGPVSPEQVILCAWRAHADGSGFQLMFGIDAERATALRDEDGVKLRAFLGYSGWGEGQLKNELKLNTWVVSPMVPDLMDRDPDDSLWRGLLVGVDAEWKLLAEEPDDPSLN